jgi:hypothetical protein
LRLSVRQFRRLKQRFRARGARGLLHGLRGRLGNGRLTLPAREQIAALMTTTYAGFNDVHLTEKLREGAEEIDEGTPGPGVGAGGPPPDPGEAPYCASASMKSSAAERKTSVRWSIPSRNVTRSERCAALRAVWMVPVPSAWSGNTASSVGAAPLWR